MMALQSATQSLQAPRRSPRLARSRAITRMALPEVQTASFRAQVLESATPVLVEVWAPWCGPSKLVNPICETAQKTYGDKLKVVKMEMDPNEELLKTYAVHGLPTLMLFKGGELVEGSKHEGGITLQGLLSWMCDHSSDHCVVEA